RARQLADRRARDEHLRLYIVLRAPYGPRMTTGVRLGLAVVALTFAVPAAADADTYPVTAGSAASLQSQLDAAAAHANSGGPDVVTIPAGIYEGSFSYSGDAVDIEG